MKHVMVRYQLHPDPANIAQNERLIAGVFEELAEARPDGLRYASYKLPDGVSFVHIAAIDTADGSNPLTTLASFQQFTRELPARCAQPPASSALVAVGVFP